MGKPKKRLSAVKTAPSNKKDSASDQKITAESSEILSTVSGIDHLLSDIGSFDDKASHVVEKMAQAANADWVAFLIPDERLEGLRVVASAGHATRRSPLPQVLPYELGLSGRAFTSAKSIVANNYPNHADALQHHIAAGEKSNLALPVTLDGVVIGIFIFGSRKTGHFTDERVGMLEAVAGYLGPMLENAKLHQELAVIDEISRTITTTLDIDEVYEQFCAELKKLVAFDRITIDIIEPNGEEFIVKYAYGEELAGRRKGDVGPVQGNQIQILIETKETLLRGNIAESPDWPMNRAALEAGLPSLTLVPLITKGRVIGCLGLRSRNINPHGSREIVILQRLASQIAPAVENTRLFEASQRAESENALLAEIGREISSSLDINEVYEHFADTVSGLIKFDRIGISLVGEGKNSLIHAYFAGTKVPERQRGEVSCVPGTQFEEVLRTGTPSLLNYENEAVVEREFPGLLPAFTVGMRSFLMVPLFSKDAVMGVMALRSKQLHAFSKHDVDLAMKIGYQIAPFVECSQLYEDLQKSADELAIGDKIATIITSAADIGELYENFAGEMKRLVGFDRLTIIQVDTNAQTFTPVFIHGIQIEERRVGMILPLEGSVTNFIVKSGCAFLEGTIEDHQSVTADRSYITNRFRSSISVPLRTEGRITSTVHLKSVNQGAYGTRDLAVIERYADRIAPAIEIARLHEETIRLAEETAVIAEIGKIISSSLDIDEVYERFAAEAGKLLDIDRITIRLLDEGQSNTVVSYFAGIEVPERQSSDATPVAGRFQLEEVLRTREPSLIQFDDHAQLENYPVLVPSYNAGLRSFLTVPLISKDKIIGVLMVRSLRHYAYTQRHVDLLARVGNQIAPAIEISQLHEASLRQAEETAVIAEIGKIINSSLDIDDVYERFTAETRKLIDFDRISIRVFDADQKNTVISYVDGMNIPGHQNRGSIPVAGRFQVEEVLRTGEPSLINLGEVNLEIFPSFLPPFKAGLRSLLAVPLFSNDRVIGLLSAWSMKEHAYIQHHVDLLLRVGNQIAGAIANSQLYEERKQAEEKERAAAVESSTLAEIGRIASSSLDIDEIYQLFSEEVQKLIPFDRLGVTILDLKSDVGKPTYISGTVVTGRRQGDVYPLAGTLAGHVAHARSTMMIESEMESELRDQMPGLIPAFHAGLRSFMAVPLFHRGDVVAVLQFRSKAPGIYLRHHLDLAERVGSQIAGAIANAQLFSERSRAEHAMRVSEQKYRTLVNESPDMIFVSRIDDFRVTEVNDRACEHYGYSREEFLAMDIFDLEDEPPLKDEVRSLYDATPVGSVLEVYGTNKKSDGTTFPVHVRFSKLDEDFAIANVRDITDQRTAEETQRRLTEESSVIAEIGKIVNSSLDIDEVYERVTEEVLKIISFDRMSVSLVDYDYQETLQMYASGVDIPGRLRGDRTPLAGALAGEVALTRSSILFEAESEEQVLDRFPLLMPAFRSGLRSFISVPLVERDSVTCVFQIRSSESGIYGPRELAMTERIAGQIAGALANARLYEESLLAQEEQRRLAQESSVIAEIGRLIGSSLDITEVYGRLSEEVAKLIPFDRISVNIIDTANSVTNPTYIAGTDVAGRRAGDTVQYMGTMTEEVARTRSPLMLEVDSESELTDHLPGLLPAFHAGLRSFLAVPLIERNNVIGALQIRSRDQNAYTRRHLDLADRIGNQIAGAIANAELYKQTRQAEEAERQRSLELDGLLKVSNILAQPGSFQDKASQVMEELANIANAESAALRVPEAGGLRRIGAKGPHPKSTTLIPLEGNIPGIAYGTKEMLVVNDYPSYQFALADRVRRGIKSVLAAPILSQESVIGVVVVNSFKNNHFNAERVSLVLGIINGLGSLLETARLEDERARAEQELRESERRFRQISENMREIVSLIDHQDHKLLYVNQAFKELWGHEADSFSEQPMRWLESVHSDDLPAVEAALDIQKSTGEFEVDYRIIRSDGTVRRVYDRTFPILNESGEIYRLVGIAEDITERKQAEERLHETARLASIGELAAGVAHEINNPLTSVQGYSEMVLTKNLPDEVSADIQTIYDEAQRAAKIVQNLLFFARRRNTEKQYLDLNSVLTRSLEMKSYDFKVSNVDVVTDLSLGDRKSMIDEHQMLQVFLNILTNAEQAMYQATGRGHIDVRAVSSDHTIEITVKDDGPGIPSEVLNRIFEPFFTTKDVGQGTGLGLSISYGIIKQHGGDIWVESAVGEGTTFHITLPVASPEELKVFEAPNLTSARKTTRHILVVDDEPQIRDLLGKYLESERYTVDLAEDGREAWRKMAAMVYDCILLDLKMPGMSGPELYELIQEISEPLAGKIVFVTGDTVSPSTRDFLSKTGNPVVAKPFRMAEILRTINELWDPIPSGV